MKSTNTKPMPKVDIETEDRDRLNAIATRTDWAKSKIVGWALEMFDEATAGFTPEPAELRMKREFAEVVGGSNGHD